MPRSNCFKLDSKDKMIDQKVRSVDCMVNFIVSIDYGKQSGLKKVLPGIGHEKLIKLKRFFFTEMYWNMRLHSKEYLDCDKKKLIFSPVFTQTDNISLILTFHL